jgi:hypothetical protein
VLPWWSAATFEGALLGVALAALEIELHALSAAESGNGSAISSHRSS